MSGPREHRNVKGTSRVEGAGEAFWDVAEPLLGHADVEEGTIMNFPCLRAGGEFFGMPHHETGDAILKLPKERVAELIDEGVGHPFGPGTKVFKEWVLVEAAHDDRWFALLEEARAFVAPRS